MCLYLNRLEHEEIKEIQGSEMAWLMSLSDVTLQFIEDIVVALQGLVED